MDRDELTKWALANGRQMIAGCPSLTKPSAPKEAIVRLVLKATVVNVEVKRPAGKWQKITSESYSKIEPDPDRTAPRTWVRYNFGFHAANGRQQEPGAFREVDSAVIGWGSASSSK